MSAPHTADYDVIAVGAGFAGISLSYHLREAGYSVKVFDRADEIGDRCMEEITGHREVGGEELAVERRAVGDAVSSGDRFAGDRVAG